MPLYRPRRFAECLEFDRRGPPWNGTSEKRELVRVEFDRILEFDNGAHRAFRKLDRAINRYGFPFVTITYHSGMSTANESQVWIGDYWDGEAMVATVFHELGHTVGMHCFNPQDRSEGWAESFKRFCANKGPVNYPVYAALQLDSL